MCTIDTRDRVSIDTGDFFEKLFFRRSTLPFSTPLNE